MDLSIIIPMYNHEKYIEECLTSIIGKGLNSNIEIIIINDASTDDSLNVVKRFSGKINNLITIQNGKNIGCAASINKALKLAKGKYIAINSSDDKVDENYYEKMLEVALRENADVVCANIATFSGKNENIIYHNTLENNLYSDNNINTLIKLTTPYKIKAKYLLGHWSASSSSTKIIKAGFYKKYNFVGTTANDIPAIYPILASANKIFYYPNLYKYYRNTPNSLSKSHSIDSYISTIDSIFLTFNLLIKIPKSIEIIQTLFYNNFLEYYFNVLLNIEDINIKYYCLNYLYYNLNDNISKKELIYNDVLFKAFLEKHSLNYNFKNGTPKHPNLLLLWLFENKLSNEMVRELEVNFNEKIIKMNELIELKNQKINYLVEKVEIIYNSTSWKVTKPIRMFKNLIYNFFRKGK
jgi:glycosyltransferase involved in cell wall biosynthesis